MYLEEYKRWLEADLEDADLNPELARIEGNDEEIKDRFAVSLKFGTAGLRGVLLSLIHISGNVGRMAVLEVIIKNSLQIDETAAIFFSQLTADCPICIHTFSHPILCIWFHVIWGHEKNTFYVIFYGKNHLLDVGTVLLRRYPVSYTHRREEAYGKNGRPPQPAR